MYRHTCPASVPDTEWHQTLSRHHQQHELLQQPKISSTHSENTVHHLLDSIRITKHLTYIKSTTAHLSTVLAWSGRWLIVSDCDRPVWSFAVCCLHSLLWCPLRPQLYVTRAVESLCMFWIWVSTMWRFWVWVSHEPCPYLKENTYVITIVYVDDDILVASASDTEIETLRNVLFMHFKITGGWKVNRRGITTYHKRNVWKT